jgi:hypothetical protein
MPPVRVHRAEDDVVLEDELAVERAELADARALEEDVGVRADLGDRPVW